MSSERISPPREFDFGLLFLSHGVRIGLAADNTEMLGRARELVTKAFGDRVQIFEELGTEVRHTFGITHEDGVWRLFKNGLRTTSENASAWIFFKYLNSLLRMEVAVYAQGAVFVHAGVVGWNGQAIIFPGISFAGKSTLTAELIRNGAEYYSDEYAVLEPNGRVAPFPRHLSLRYFGATREREVPPEELGGRTGTKPIPVGMVLLTSFSKGAQWDPEFLSPGAGIMEIIPNTLTMHRDPAFTLKVLDLAARRAIIVKSPRGDVKKFAKFLLAFFDKHSKLAKIA